MDILMPPLGASVEEGKLIKWFKAAGERVTAGDLLFEIETDKSSMEIEATVSGALSEIRVEAGKIVRVGAILGVVSGEGEAPVREHAAADVSVALASAPGSLSSARVATSEPSGATRAPGRNFGPATLASGAKITPLARRLAAERNLSVSALVGSGPRGRISAADVLKADTPASVVTPPSPGPGPGQVKSIYAGVAYREVELDGMRRTIAKRLTEAKQTVPHFYLSADVGIERLLDLRAEMNTGRGAHFTLNDFVIKAFARALALVPAANAAWAEDRILQFDGVDISVAVAIDGGLITPVLRRAEQKSLTAISSEIKDLVVRAQQRKLTPADYQGGSTTVSNLGMYGVRQFQAIINPPQASILAVGAAGRRPIETSDGGLRFTSQMSVTLSVDHRVLDGAIAAKLLSTVAAGIENPIELLT